LLDFAQQFKQNGSFACAAHAQVANRNNPGLRPVDEKRKDPEKQAITGSNCQIN
jgi:hypothetical protein